MERPESLADQDWWLEAGGGVRLDVVPRREGDKVVFPVLPKTMYLEAACSPLLRVPIKAIISNCESVIVTL